MQPRDLIRTAQALLTFNDGDPSQADLRRAISTAYYALFHYMCRECADRLVGCTAAHQCKPAWRQTYRALAHSQSKARCEKIKGDEALKFPTAIRDFATLYILLQELRHRADYDMRDTYSAFNVQSYVDDALAMIEATERVATKHRKAFAVFLLMPLRDKSGH